MEIGAPERDWIVEPIVNPVPVEDRDEVAEPVDEQIPVAA
jgi:hypothetical protein